MNEYILWLKLLSCLGVDAHRPYKLLGIAFLFELKVRVSPLYANDNQGVGLRLCMEENLLE